MRTLRKLISLFLLVILSTTLTGSGNKVIAPVELRTEFRKNPLGLDTAKPRFSWIVEDSTPGAKQTAYQVQAASSPEKLAKGAADLWDSGKVTSEQSHLVEYAGKTLVSRQQVWWRVKTWDRDGKEGGWSKPASLELGLLALTDWGKSQWITALKVQPVTGEAMNAWIEKATIPKGGEKPGMNPETAKLANEQIIAFAREELSKVTPTILLRKEFSIPANIRRARLYIATLGFHELRINGALVDDHRLEPSVGHYSQRAYYVVKELSTVLQTIHKPWYLSLTVFQLTYHISPRQLASSSTQGRRSQKTPPGSDPPENPVSYQQSPRAPARICTCFEPSARQPYGLWIYPNPNLRSAKALRWPTRTTTRLAA